MSKGGSRTKKCGFGEVNQSPGWMDRAPRGALLLVLRAARTRIGVRDRLFPSRPALAGR